MKNKEYCMIACNNFQSHIFKSDFKIACKSLIAIMCANFNQIEKHIILQINNVFNFCSVKYFVFQSLEIN